MANRVVTKQKMTNSVDPNEMAHMSHLIRIYTVKFFLLVCGAERFKPDSTDVSLLVLSLILYDKCEYQKHGFGEKK